MAMTPYQNFTVPCPCGSVIWGTRYFDQEGNYTHEQVGTQCEQPDNHRPRLVPDPED